MEMERGLVKTSAGYVHYRAFGQGKPVVLLHVNPQSSAMYLELMQVLGKERRAIAIDYPGYGMSDHVEGQPTLAQYGKWVMETLDGLKVQKASFLGEATGAFVSVELANAYRDRVDKIVLVSCPFWVSREFNKQRHDVVKGEQRPVDSSGFPMPRTLEFVLAKDPEHIPMHPDQSWMDRDNLALIEAGRDRWKALNAVDDYDLASNLERLQCPVLLVWGEHFFYLKYRDEVTRRLKDHQVLVIKNGRFNLPWEFPDLIGQTVLKFLA